MFSKAKSSKNKADAKSQNGALHDPQEAQQSTSQAISKRSNSMKATGVPSIISADVVMQGNISSAGEIQFDGTLEGDLKASSLIIGDKAIIKGEVICETVTVRGRVEGGIRAKSVALAASSNIQGDILHSSLSVETGAHFEGNCRHSDDPLSDSSAKDFRRTRPSSPAPRPIANSDDTDGKGRKGSGDAPSFLSQGGRSPLR